MELCKRISVHFQTSDIKNSLLKCQLKQVLNDESRFMRRSMSKRATPITERDRSRSKCGQRLRDFPHAIGPASRGRSRVN